MTSQEQLALERIILNEASAGQWSDANLYILTNSGQNMIIDFVLSKERTLRKIDPTYRHPILAPLISLDPLNTTTVGASEKEYALPTGYLATYRAEYDSAGTTTRHNATEDSYENIHWAFTNSYQTPAQRSPKYYIRSGNIGFYPQPTGAGANAYNHYYYAAPTAIASGTNPTLKNETHEAMVEYAVAKALQQDGEYELANVHLQNFLSFVSQL